MNDHTVDYYKATPLRHVDGIPVFSESDEYVVNYDQISDDHLQSLQACGHNPFMDEQHWLEIEASTEVLLRKHAFAGAKVLDVGVGMGRLLERFPDLDRFGMDISLGYLTVAARKSIKVCMSKIEDMPFTSEYFDLCVCTDVLEHVLDLNLAVKRILDVLKPGGALIVRVPYREDLSGYLAPDFPYDLVHLRTFDEPELVLLFTKIFRQHVEEISKAGWAGGTARWVSEIRYVRGVLRLMRILLSKLLPSRRLSLARLFNHPTEINIVVRKSDR